MKTRSVILILALMAGAHLVFPGALRAGPAKLRIVTTTSVLASLAEAVAGEHADIFHVASPKRDLHRVEPTPKDVLKVRRADVFIHHGLQAEPWLSPLLTASGRQEFLTESPRVINASRGIEALEIPGQVTRLEGDIHPEGNPHYWLDPVNAKQMVETITRKLIQVAPEHAGTFGKKRDAWLAEFDTKMTEWQRRMAPWKGTAIVTYHRSWVYFARRFELRIAGEIEPKPGIPPTSRHLGALMRRMKEEAVKLVIKEPLFERRTPEKVAAASNAEIVDLVQFVGGARDTDDYFSLMDYNITQIEKALGGGD